MEIPGGLKCIQSRESTIKSLAEELADLLLGVRAGGRKGDNLNSISPILLPVSWKQRQPETWLKRDSCPVCSSWPRARLVARGGKKHCWPIKWKCVCSLNLETVHGGGEITPAGERTC